MSDTRYIVTQATGSSRDGQWLAVPPGLDEFEAEGNGVTLVDTGASEVRRPDGARAPIWTLDLEAWRKAHPEATLAHDVDPCRCEIPITSGRGLCAGSHCDRCGRPLDDPPIC